VGRAHERRPSPGRRPCSPSGTPPARRPRRRAGRSPSQQTDGAPPGTPRAPRKAGSPGRSQPDIVVRVRTYAGGAKLSDARSLHRYRYPGAQRGAGLGEVGGKRGRDETQDVDGDGVDEGSPLVIVVVRPPHRARAPGDEV